MKLLYTFRALSTAALLSGLSACAAPSATSAGPAQGGLGEAASAGVTRDAAVKVARIDAVTHFQAQPVTATARQAGGYWVVELRTQSGAGLRYAISSQDGSIRQRDSFQ